MKKYTSFEFTDKEVLKILQDHVNAKEQQNHELRFDGSTIMPKTVELNISQWDKDEESH